MEESIIKEVAVIRDLFQEKLVPILIQKIKIHNDAISKIEVLQQQLMSNSYSQENKAESISVFKTYKTDLNQIISNYFNTNHLNNKDALLDQYYLDLDMHLSSLDQVVTRVQDKDRFYALETDTKKIKFKKALKLKMFSLSRLPIKFINVFKKTKKPICFWTQKIPFQNITQHYFKNELVQNISIIINEIYEEISTITAYYWQVDKKIDQQINNYLNNDVELVFDENLLTKPKTNLSINERIENFKVSLNNVFDTTLVSYNEAIYKSGTMELSNSKFETRRVDQLNKDVLKKYVKNESLWLKTYTVFKDDWELDIEIFNVLFKLLINYWNIHKQIEVRSEIIKVQLGSIENYIIKVSNELEHSSSTDEIKNEIIKEIKDLKKVFSKIISKTTTIITNQEFSILINDFQNEATEILKSISDSRIISKETDYAKQISLASINTISPYELINYQSWPTLSEKINKTKVDLTLKINDLIEDIDELVQVNQFNLESALSLFDDNSNENSPKEVVLEVNKRGLEKVNELKKVIENIPVYTDEILFEGVQSFNKSILKLTETENIFEIKLTIAKAMSIEKSKQLKRQVISSVKNFIPIALITCKTNYNKAKNTIQGFLLRSGLYKEKSGITSDLSNFLTEAEHALNQLPYVYQRLFRSETLQNHDLFIGRESALINLEEAHNAFTKQRYSATIIIGERGAGKTSLFHYFFNQQKKSLKTQILSPNNTMYRTADFIVFLNDFFSENLETLEEWIAYFNTSRKKIIVLENIQYLYFRKVNGFEVLHDLAKLITATKKSVFWIVTCSKYAYEYLNKAIQISEIFHYKIEMDDVDKETMTNALIKRHKMSGYSLYFEEPPKQYLSKKFLKLDAGERQNILKDDFFNDINKIAKSDFKIAFMYWIRSANSVLGSTIHMRSLKNIDVSFLDKLSPTKLILLTSILLHEKLNSKSIVELLDGNEKTSCKILHSLFEDGILTIDEDEYYTINTLLYRQITSLLKSKNFIH